jgi:hypothetical protein
MIIITMKKKQQPRHQGSSKGIESNQEIWERLLIAS